MYAIVFLILTVYDLEVRANLRRKVFGFDAWRGGVGGTIIRFLFTVVSWRPVPLV